MRLIDMDTHFAPVDEFAYVADDLKQLTPAWLPQGNGRVAMVTPNWPEAPIGSGLTRPHPRYQGHFDIANRHKVPISVHANTRDWGTVTDPRRMGNSWGFFVATLADYLTITCSLIYSGVFDVFPDLKFFLGEGGATWLLWAWDRLALT